MNPQTPVGPQLTVNTPTSLPPENTAPQKKVSRLKWFLIGAVSMFLALVIVLPIIGFFAMTTLTIMNPGGQFEKARDVQRQADLLQINNAIQQYVQENNGELPPGLPNTKTCIGTEPPCYDLSQWIVPDFIADVPEDPSSGDRGNTGYTLFYTPGGRVIVEAKGEANSNLKVER